MRIERIDLFHVAMPLITPWRTAYGEDAVVESVLCRMSSGQLSAWGESCPLAGPCYSPEWAGGVYAVAERYFAPRLLGQEIRSGQQLQDQLAIFKGNPFAKALFDNAWWMLESQRLQQPLHRQLGATRDEIPVGADFGVRDTVEELLDLIASAVAAGFPRIKLKFRPGWDLPMLRRVRDAFPDTVFHIDCNSGYSLEDLEMFREIDELHLAMIEQPLAHDDVHDHAILQSQLQTPICLDESISSPAQAKRALELGSCRFVNIKPGRVGGLTNALRIHDLCVAAKIPCWVGGMLESAIGASHCIALGMLDQFSYPADIFPSCVYYREDLGQRPIELSRNSEGSPVVVASENAPQPDMQRLEACTIQRTTISV